MKAKGNTATGTDAKAPRSEVGAPKSKPKPPASSATSEEHASVTEEDVFGDMVFESAIDAIEIPDDSEIAKVNQNVTQEDCLCFV